MHIYPSGAKYGPVHADTVRYWMVQTCTRGNHRYVLVDAVPWNSTSSILERHILYLGIAHPVSWNSTR
jgi:hypothetical protein